MNIKFDIANYNRIFVASLGTLAFLLIFAFNFVFSLDASLMLLNDTNDTNQTFVEFSQDLLYDRSNQTIFNLSFGSDSYMDYSPTNKNLFLKLCDTRLRPNQLVDLAYVSFSRNLTKSLLSLPVQVNAVVDNCTMLDVVLSSTEALYPGRIMVLVYDDYDSYQNSIPAFNITNLNYLRPTLNGSYKISVFIDAPPKVYYFAVDRVFDDKNLTIQRLEPGLVVSFVNGSNVSAFEEILAPKQTFIYTKDMIGNEKIYVNGIESLKIKVLSDPCAEINESGYYIINNSKLNYNESCMKIENQTQIVINFGPEIIDGDANPNGSLANNSCPVIIRNSQNVSIERLKTQDYRFGICVYNSTVNVIGDASTYNLDGALISDNSKVKFVDVMFSSVDSDLLAQNDSLVHLINVTIPTAQLTSDFEDSIVKSVKEPPPKPNITNLLDIGQFVEYHPSEKNNNDSWAIIKFHYSEDILEYVTTDNISIFEYNGTYVNTTILSFDNETNTLINSTLSGWFNGTWKKLYTLVSPSEQLIMSLNLSNFSVFAPFGFKKPPEPKPEPQPQPEPEPTQGDSSGEGGTPKPSGGPGSPTQIPVGTEKKTHKFPLPLTLKLDLPKNITLMQGEVGSYIFNLTNLGDGLVYNLTVFHEILKGWDTSMQFIDNISAGQKINRSIELSVYEKAIPKTYYVPVIINVTYDNESREVTRKLLKVIVIPRGNLSRLMVLEYPRTVVLAPNYEQKIAFFLKNIGDRALPNLTIKYEPNPCIESITGTGYLNYSDERTLLYSFKAKDISRCQTDYYVKFYSNDKLVGFAPVTFIVKEKGLFGKLFEASEIKLLISFILLLLWTLVTYRVHESKNV